jgi:hypothetical protein
VACLRGAGVKPESLLGVISGKSAVAAALALFCATAPRPASGVAGDGGERVFFSALNKQERPVLGLGPDDFQLRVNGRTEEPGEFKPGRPRSDTTIPLVLWILIDSNPDIDAHMIARQARAGAEMFGRLHPDSAIGVKLVSDRSETLAPLGHDPEAVRRAFVDFTRVRNEVRAQGAWSVLVGTGGIVRAAELAMDELDSFVVSSAPLRGNEVRRAILIISDGNINPRYSKRELYARAARLQVFLYPVFVPRPHYGAWVEDYLDLGNRTAGVGSVLGALTPGAKGLRIPQANAASGALMFNLLHMIADLNGKYSFAKPQSGGELRLDLKCRAKNVQVRIAK